VFEVKETIRISLRIIEHRVGRALIRSKFRMRIDVNVASESWSSSIDSPTWSATWPALQSHSTAGLFAKTALTVESREKTLLDLTPSAVQKGYRPISIR
jgi:hypothetical protein